MTANSDQSEEYSEQVEQQDSHQLISRIETLERRVDELTGKLEEILGNIKPESTASPADKQQGFLPESLGEQLTPEMKRIIAKMNAGQADEAFGDLKAMPREELAAQPVSVALIAAALSVQRGEYEAGLKAIQRVKQLTDDPRVLTLLKRLESRAKAG